MNSLYDPYKKFFHYFQANRNYLWDKWLQIASTSPSSGGKQGYVGILEHPTNSNLSCLYKISKVDDNLVEHEYKILKALEGLCAYCPHFHRAFGIVPFFGNLHLGDSPLEYNTKTKIVERSMLLMQNIPHKYNFREMIEDEQIKDDLIINVLKQVVLCIYFIQAYRVTHYDLHTENILIRTCHSNMYLLYILDSNTQILLPSNGFIPNIIDYGFGYGDVPENDLTCTLMHTQVGFTSARFDPFADIKLFLISTVDDIARESIRDRIAPKLQNIVRNIFSGINVQWTCGWDNSKQLSPIVLLQELIKDYVGCSSLFSKSDLWVDSIQELIQLPLSPMPSHDFKTAFEGFLSEFIKFEDRIVSKTLLNYILRILVRIVKKYRSAYLNATDKFSIVSNIRSAFMDEYCSLINFHSPSIDYERMVRHLLMISECMEGFFYDILEKRYQEKDRQYEIIRLQNILDYYRVLDYNFPISQDRYDIRGVNIKSSILVIDHLRQKSKLIYLKNHSHALPALDKFKHSIRDADLLNKTMAKYFCMLYEAELL